MTINIPAGFYTLSESKERKKIFIKGKDLLKILIENR